jgi:hypothetical protein
MIDHLKGTGLIGAVVVVLVACGSPVRSSSQGAASFDPVAPPPTQRRLLSGIRTVDWSNIAVPGRTCLAAGDIQLRDGEALIRHDERGHPVLHDENRNLVGSEGDGVRYVHLTLGDVFYGDLEGSGGDVAAVRLSCDNNGGMAAGRLLHSIVVFRERAGTPVVLAVLSPRHQPEDAMPTGLIVRTISPGRMVVEEGFYGPWDLTCCPTGRAITTWVLSAGKLVPGTTRVTVSPPTDPPPALAPFVEHSKAHPERVPGTTAEGRFPETT